MDHNTWLSNKWPLEAMDSNEYSILQNIAQKPIQSVSNDILLEEIISNSENFPISFPIDSIRIKELQKSVDKATLTQNVTSTYPVMHERTLGLFHRFLEFKREYGTLLEQNLYKDMNILDLVDRILLKRSVTFCGGSDLYLLLSKHRGTHGWESIGKPEEKPPLILKDCLSYDEMKLSALLYVSGRTVFINNGNRRNEGVVDPNLEENIQKEGIIIGLIGARYHKKLAMEYEECIITAEQNTTQNGFGSKVPSRGLFDLLPLLNSLSDYSSRKTLNLWRKLWFDFYKADSLTFADAKSRVPGDHLAVLSDQLKASSPLIFISGKNQIETIFNNEMYSKRLSITFDVLLLESNERAKENNTTAYIHVVGIGLGVWKVRPHQTDVFVQTFISRMKEHMSRLHSVSDVHFAYFDPVLPEIATDGMILEDKSHPLGGIKVHISRREPSSKLTGIHGSKLLVESYAWDSNAHPGNNFWMGNLYTSGDPAAACSTQVAELHNAHINKKYACGKNLHVAGRFGVKHIVEYCKLAAKEQLSQE